MIAIIAAMAKNRVIGRHGKIPWDIREDRERFKKLTMGNILVMGRKTYEEIGHPLPGRMTYVVSTTRQIEEKNCHTVKALSEALEREDGRNIFICGGARLYEEAMEIADYIYLTELDMAVEGDTFFPVIRPSVFQCVLRERGKGAYCFQLYKRKT